MNTSAFSLEILCAAFTHPGQLPLHSLVLQTSQLFHRPSVSTMQLYCMWLSSGQTRVYDPFSHPPVFKMRLTSHNFWLLGHTPDYQIFCWRRNASQSQTVKPIVHLFLIDTEHKSTAMAVISCMEKFKIPTDCSRNVTFWDSLQPNCNQK